MCVAVPGRIVEIGERSPASVPARVDFGDRTLDIDLVMLPDAEPGDWIIAHSGYAIRATAEPSGGSSD